MAATWRLLDSNLAYGQANAFTFAAILCSLESTARGRDLRAGFWIGSAAAFKILPGTVLVLYAAQRRWKALWSGALTFLVLAAGLPLLVLGPSLTVTSHEQWFEGVLHPFVEGGDALQEIRPNVMGQSLVAIAYRNLTDTPLSGNDTSLRGNWVAWDPRFVHGIVQALVAAHALAFAFALWRARRRPRELTLVPLAALALATVLLSAPVVHRAHMLWSMLGLALVAEHAVRGHPSRMRFGLRIALALILSGIGLTTSGLIGRSAARAAMGHGVIGVSIELLWLTLWLHCSRGVRTADQPWERSSLR